jgi:hypothetical protein
MLASVGFAELRSPIKKDGPSYVHMSHGIEKFVLVYTTREHTGSDNEQ